MADRKDHHPVGKSRATGAEGIPSEHPHGVGNHRGSLDENPSLAVVPPSVDTVRLGVGFD